MNVTVEQIGSCRKKLNIEIPETDVAQEWTGVVKEFQRFAQIPGFRAGKAPVNVLEKKFEKEISQEVQRKLIPSSYREALAKEKIKAVSSPSIDEIKFEKKAPLKFQATVDVSPEFATPEFKGLKINKKKVEITDQEVDNALSLLAEQQASFDEIKDRPLKLGDFAVIAYEGKSNGKSLTEINESAKPLAENKQFWLLMAKDSFLPGFCDPLVGVSVGEKKDLQVEIPKDFRIKELAGVKVDYHVEVNGIREKKLPPIDEAFAKTYQVASIQELKDRIRENLVRDREQANEASTRSQIIEQLLKAVDFEVPESILNDETRTSMMEIVRENQSRGISPEMLKESSKDILQAAQQSARDKVKATFILARIAEEQKLEVKDQDIQDEIQQASKRTGRPVAEILKQVQESGEIEMIKEQVLVRRALDLVISHAIVETE